jgi:hypothetical protein
LPLRELSSADDVGLVGSLDIIARRRVEQQEANVRIGPLDRVSCGWVEGSSLCPPQLEADPARGSGPSAVQF